MALPVRPIDGSQVMIAATARAFMSDVRFWLWPVSMLLAKDSTLRLLAE
jgi:hypothetical protein